VLPLNKLSQKHSKRHRRKNIKEIHASVFSPILPFIMVCISEAASLNARQAGQNEPSIHWVLSLIVTVLFYTHHSGFLAVVSAPNVPATLLADILAVDSAPTRRLHYPSIHI